MSYPRKSNEDLIFKRPGRGRVRACLRAYYERPVSPPHHPGRVNRSSDSSDTEETNDHPSVSDVSSHETSSSSTSSSPTSSEMSIFTERHQTRQAELLRKHKQGTTGTGLKLIANYFRLNTSPGWALYQYRVDFQPEPDRLDTRKAILLDQKDILGAYIFDGTMLYKSSPLTEETTILSSNNINVQLKNLGIVPPGDHVYTKFYNFIVKKCLYGLELEKMGPHFYDRHAAITLSQHRLQLWPGYITSMRRHENDVLFCVELTHKILQQDDVLMVINNLMSRENFEEALEDELKGAIVMTSYNRRTYRVDDIDFTGNPLSTFEKEGKEITYVEYYKNQHNIDISDINQPLLLSRPSRKELHRGHTNNILLIPELCQLTGLTDQMRDNFNLMKDVTEHLHMIPSKKVSYIQRFMNRIRCTPPIMKEIGLWGIEFDKLMVEIPGRILCREQLLFGDGTSELTNDKADWTRALQSKKLLIPIMLDRWIILVPQRDGPSIDNLIQTMIKVSEPLNFQIRPPMQVVSLNNTTIATYIEAIDNAEQSGNDYQMIFVILPNSNSNRYSAVKKRLSVDMGIPSQCFLARNIDSKGLTSIATKMTIQMCTKLGGEPWSINLPLKNLMVVGFDVYSGDIPGFSIGAMVATTSASLGSYYSITSTHKSNIELARNLNVSLQKCCNAYKVRNGFLPDRIIMYRDGVSVGESDYVESLELKQVQEAIIDLYDAERKQIPKLSFIVVTKKIRTRFFTANVRVGSENPPPGTVVDDVVTLPDRYDFFLVPQTARRRTVSPTSFHVMHDTQGLSPDRMQQLTYKMCHMSFNHSSIVTVPAPCQYAHKLALLAGTSLRKHPHEKLSYNLHYL